MQDVDAIARHSLDARMAAITARTLVRAAAKIMASKKARREAGNRNNSNDAPLGLLGALAVQVAVVAERADTRSWLTLPRNIQLARLPLPPGSYTIKVELLGADGQIVASSEYPEVVISKTHKTYLTQHWVPAQLATTRR